MGIASVHEEYHGGRDFWFERKHLSSRVCEFDAADDNTGLALNLTFGAVPYYADVRTGKCFSLRSCLRTRQNMRYCHIITYSRGAPTIVVK